MNQLMKIRLLSMVMVSAILPSTFVQPIAVFSQDYEYQEDDRLEQEGWGFFDDVLIVTDDTGFANYLKNGKEQWNAKIKHLSFEKDVTQVDFSQFSNIVSISFSSPTPPAFSVTDLDAYQELVSIYIPENTTDAYQKAFGTTLSTLFSEITAEDLDDTEVIIEENPDVEDKETHPVILPASNPASSEESAKDIVVSQEETVETGKTQSVKTGVRKTIGNGTYQVMDHKKAIFLHPKKKTYRSFVIPKTITIGDRKYKVTQIGKNAFKKNKKLTSVTIPNTVTHIGARAFYQTPKLKKVKILSKNLKSIGKNAFGKTGAKVYVPKKQKKKYTKMLVKRGLKKKNIR